MLTKFIGLDWGIALKFPGKLLLLCVKFCWLTVLGNPCGIIGLLVLLLLLNTLNCCCWCCCCKSKLLLLAFGLIFWANKLALLNILLLLFVSAPLMLLLLFELLYNANMDCLSFLPSFLKIFSNSLGFCAGPVAVDIISITSLVNAGNELGSRTFSFCSAGLLETETVSVGGALIRNLQIKIFLNY